MSVYESYDKHIYHCLLNEIILTSQNKAEDGDVIRNVQK